MALIRSLIIWALAILGVALFAWYVIAAGQASIGATEPPTLEPPNLAAFGTAAGVVLATNLGAFLGIVIKNGLGGGLSAITNAQQQPWAQLLGALAYLVILGIAFYFYWQSDFNQHAADVIVNSFATIAGVLIGAMTALFNAK